MTGPSAAPAPRQTALMWLDPAQLVDHPTEAGELGELDGLVASIRAVGIQVPLLVVEAVDADRWVIVDGHHRAAAARVAGLEAVPCQVKRGIDATVVGLAINGTRRVLSPVAQARGFGRLRDRGLTVAQIAARTGYAEGHVSDRLALLELDEGFTDPDGVQANHFGPLHRLAAAAADRCAGEHGRRAPGRLGGVACGPCWEHAIRADERTSARPRINCGRPLPGGGTCMAPAGHDPAQDKELPQIGGTRRAGKPGPATTAVVAVDAGAAPAAETRGPVPPTEKGGPAAAPVAAAGPRPPARPSPAGPDEALVAAFLAGGRGNCDLAALSRADRLEVARRVVADGGTPADLASLLGLSWDAAARLISTAQTTPRGSTLP